MQNIVSLPETAIYVENGRYFKATAPKEPLKNDLERYLRSQLNEFLKFRRDILGQKEIGTDADIAKAVNDILITEPMLKRYNELALIIDINVGKDKELINKYIEKGVDVNAKLADGATPLHFACQNGNTGVVEKLLAADGILVNQVNKEGATPLSIACENGHAAVVEKLLKAGGILVNQANKEGAAPLHVASYRGHTAVVEKLLADSRIYITQKSNGYTSSDIAREVGNKVIEDMLVKAEQARNKPAKVVDAKAVKESEIKKTDNKLKDLETIAQATQAPVPTTNWVGRVTSTAYTTANVLSGLIGMGGGQGVEPAYASQPKPEISNGVAIAMAVGTLAIATGIGYLAWNHLCKNSPKAKAEDAERKFQDSYQKEWEMAAGGVGRYRD